VGSGASQAAMSREKYNQEKADFIDAIEEYMNALDEVINRSNLLREGGDVLIKTANQKNYFRSKERNLTEIAMKYNDSAEKLRKPIVEWRAKHPTSSQLTPPQEDPAKIPVVQHYDPTLSDSIKNEIWRPGGKLESWRR